MNKRSAFFLLSILFVFYQCLFPLSIHGKTWEEEFHQHIRYWMDELANEDPAFRFWKTADFTTQALGPNLKQWLVTVKGEDGETLGYLIVGMERKNHSFKLLEYGLGTYTLFDGQRIESKAEQRISMHYKGLESHWQIRAPSSENVTIIDAKSGEVYPQSLAIRPEKSEEQPGITKEAKLNRIQYSPFAQIQSPFDHIGWLQAPPEQKISRASRLFERLLDAPIAYVDRLFSGKVLAPYIVKGGHRWGDSWYVALEDQGLRYLPYHTLKGAFVQLHRSGKPIASAPRTLGRAFRSSVMLDLIQKNFFEFIL